VIELVCLVIGGAGSGSTLEQCLTYTFKGTLATLDGTIANYTGLYMHTFIIGGAAFQFDEPLYVGTTTTPINFQANVWNALTFIIDTQIKVTVGTQTATLSAGVGADTNGVVKLGSIGDLAVGYDNVVVSIKR
jgi:hypothetical protein